MAEHKTKKTTSSVEEFLNSLTDEIKKADSFKLLELFKKATNEPPVMWGTSIVGFGLYHYKSERSAQEGDWMLVGFSPRKQNLTLYVLHGIDTSDLLKLGKHKTSSGSMGGCLYINKLADVDLNVLEEIIAKSYKAMKEKHN